jgi:hypothetical protein
LLLASAHEGAVVAAGVTGNEAFDAEVCDASRAEVVQATVRTSAVDAVAPARSAANRRLTRS